MFVTVIFGFVMIASFNQAQRVNDAQKSNLTAAVYDSIIVTQIKADIALDTAQIKRIEEVLIPSNKADVNLGQFMMSSFGNFSSRLPIVFMFAMPFFAVITRLFFRRRYKRYIPHLIYAIHLHTAFFIVITVAMLVSLFYYSNYISGAIFAWFVCYSLISSMRFFGSTWWGSLLKGGVVLFLYLLFCIVVLILGLFANLYYDSLITGTDLSVLFNEAISR